MRIGQVVKRAARSLGVELRHYNCIHSEEARFFEQLRYQNVDLVVDVGANDGGYGRFLRGGGYSGDILSFEPLDAVHRRLVENAAGDARWRVAPRMALGEEDAEVELNVARNTSSSSILQMEDLHVDAAPMAQYVDVERVPMRRLDGLGDPTLSQSRALLLKIDVQGYEMPVLKGARDLLPRVRGIQLELSLVQLYKGQPLYREVLASLQELGFELWNLLPVFVDPRSGRLLQMDGVLFR